MEGAIIARDFQLKEKLGYGSFGEVFLAINRKTNEEVAVKL